MKSRILIVFVGFLAMWGLLIARGAFLQFVPNGKLETLRNRQFETLISLQDRRGVITDRFDRQLAASALKHSLYADPKIVENRKKLSARLGKVLGLPVATVYSKLKDTSRRFVWIARMLDDDVTSQIKNWNEKGLQFVEEYKRTYPNQTLLASTLGTVGSEGQGLDGIELAFDDKLRGSHRKLNVRRDARGRPLFSSQGSGMMFSEIADGSELKLTIDSELQYKLEHELSEAVKEFQADQAFGVILQAQTSEVLAMANTPQFDANEALRLPSEIKRNRSISDAFEPGSTMKTFVIATAIENKLVAPNTKFNTESGHFKIGNRMIKEAEAKDKWDSLSVSEILSYSSNIGTAKVALQVGDERLHRGLESFGFGSKTGIGLMGEAKGTLLSTPWRDHLLANISFGQGIAVTPLQIANAYAAIANGGVLRSPSLILGYRDSETGEFIKYKQDEGHRVLRPEVAKQMQLMLAGVTTPGATGVSAKVDGFMVGGKTGTAQKANPNGGGYKDGGYVSSFAGFIPANDPKFVIFVVVDRPKKKDSYYGAQVAAPLFSRLAGFAVRQAGLAPVLISEKDIPKFFPKLSKPAKAVVSSVDVNSKQVPQLQSLTVREVVQQLKASDFNIRWIGQGVVDHTEPAAGENIPNNKVISVYLK